MLKQLNDWQLDVIKEIGSIASAHAATALSHLFGKTIRMQMPAAEVIPISDINLKKITDQEVTAVRFNVTGRLEGQIFTFFSADDAHRLIEASPFTNGGGSDQTAVYDMVSSAISEISNILAGSYLTALSDFAGIQLKLTPPQFIVDQAIAILNEGLLEIALYDNDALYVDTVLCDAGTDTQLQGNIVFLPSPGHIQPLLALFGAADE
ncbi:chemotaxis protein CheC [Tuberibacillus sp. Marseille-P3662]|uniref:chemotaxis protein CheC n=1 Tax=Tuberibacillus sp. Marseille-P3662 TaxID=1965358 RepID=UPI000A1C8125|nr:chemotaxis protein CheC [Tuberibacillus sp. Marseille-P3662]